MIDLLVSHLNTRIEAIPWVDRYGGLVRTFETLEPITETASRPKRFPVSCNVTAKECYEKGKFYDLAPNTAYKSVVYIEQRSGLGMSLAAVSRGRIAIITADLRVVAWLNGPKLGVDSCLLATNAAMEMIRAVNVDMKRLTTPFIIQRLQFTPAGALRTDPQSVFDRYTYRDMDTVMYSPYAFFGLDVKLTARINVKCLPALMYEDPDECIRYAPIQQPPPPAPEDPEPEEDFVP